MQAKHVYINFKRSCFFPEFICSHEQHPILSNIDNSMPRFKNERSKRKISKNCFKKKSTFSFHFFDLLLALWKKQPYFRLERSKLPYYSNHPPAVVAAHPVAPHDSSPLLSLSPPPPSSTRVPRNTWLGSDIRPLVFRSSRVLYTKEQREADPSRVLQAPFTDIIWFIAVLAGAQKFLVFLRTRMRCSNRIFLHSLTFASTIINGGSNVGNSISTGLRFGFNLSHVCWHLIGGEAAQTVIIRIWVSQPAR